MHGADGPERLVAEALHGAGVTALFGLMGMGNLDTVLRFAELPGTRYVGVRHEAAAVTAADAWARVTGRVGVCTVTRGPGFTNAVTALVEAVRSRTPLVVVTGEAGPPHPQALDTERLVAATGAACVRVRSADTTAAATLRALEHAAAHRVPTVLVVPSGVPVRTEPEPAEPPAAATPHPGPLSPPAADLDAAATVLGRAERPVLLAGRGAVDAGPALRAVAERCGALLATTVMAKGVFAGDPFHIGVSGGFSTPLARELLGAADAVLAVGAGLNDWTLHFGGLYPAAARWVRCDADPAAFTSGPGSAVTLLGDARTTAEALLPRLPPTTGARTPPLARRIARHAPECTVAADGLDPRALFTALDRMLPADRVVAVDGGHFFGFPAGWLSVPDGRSWVWTQSFMSVGLGLASGLGAAVGRPDRLAVAVVGDGGMFMSLGELETLVRAAVPLLVVVVNDAAYGAEVHHLAMHGRPTHHAVFDDRDLAATARALGAGGVTVRALDDLDRVGRWLAAPAGPLVLDCKVTRDVRGDWFPPHNEVTPHAHT